MSSNNSWLILNVRPYFTRNLIFGLIFAVEFDTFWYNFLMRVWVFDFCLILKQNKFTDLMKRIICSLDCRKPFRKFNHLCHNNNNKYNSNCRKAMRNNKNKIMWHTQITSQITSISNCNYVGQRKIFEKHYQLHSQKVKCIHVTWQQIIKNS